MTRPWEMTNEMFDNLQVGMVFHEFFTYWTQVVAIGLEGLIARNLPGNGEWEPAFYWTQDHFRERYRYGSIDGYWVAYHGIKPIPEEFENLTRFQVDVMVEEALRKSPESRFMWVRERFAGLDLD